MDISGCKTLRRLTRRELIEKPLAGAVLLTCGSPPLSSGAVTPAIRLVHDGNDIRFVAGNVLVCRMLAIATAPAIAFAEAPRFGQSKADQMDRRVLSGPWEISDRIRRLAPGLFEWHRTWKNISDKPIPADFCLEVESGYACESTLVPAVSYDGNREHARGGIKGLANDNGPWIISGYRGSVPGASYSDGGGWSIFLFASAEKPSIDCGVSLVPKERSIVHRLLWPEQDNTRRRGATPAYQGSIEIRPGEAFETGGYLALRPAPEPRKAWRAGLDHAWRLNRHDIKAWYPPKRLWDLSVQYAQKSLWYEGPDFTGFNIGLTSINGKWQQRPTLRYEIGWCGQNAAFGAALLQDYLWNKNEESLRKGEKTLDFWAENARLKCGLFYTSYDAKLGYPNWSPYNPTFLNRPVKPGEKYVDTCNLGHGVYQFLVASELAGKLGKSKPQWRKFALDACDFFVGHALADGTFGKAWSLDGECLAEDSTTGAYFVWPMVKAYRLTHDAKYLKAAQRAFRTYVDRDLNHLTCWGGAVDADCLDKESVQPLLLAALDLYEVTGRKEYLRDAEMAAYYLASWQWHYSVPFRADSPLLTDMKYDIFSSTSVSVQGTGQDPWGEFIALGWLRLAKATGNQIWRDRAIQTFRQGMIGVSDGNLVLKGMRRPVGSQNEGFGYSRRPGEKEFYGDYNNWLVAWPAAFRLITLMHWPQWRDFEA